MTDEIKVIKVGSRKSQLAMIQTNFVVAQLKEIYPGVEFEITTMTTTGDKILDTALSKIGEKSLFTKELENGLLDRSVDFVVHSLKDLPTVLPEGLVVGAVCKRDSPYDAVVMHPDQKDQTLSTLPKDSVIGTSSLRRSAQLHRKYPHLKIKDIRGNLNTRYDKLIRAQDYQALILAEAGLDRMGWQDRMSYRLGSDECLYAVAQGAMAVECRAGDQKILDFVSKLNDYNTLLEVVTERAFLMKLLSLSGGVFSIDGEQGVMDSMTTNILDQCEPSAKRIPRMNGPRQFAAIVAEQFPQDALQAAKDLGTQLAEKMMAAGAHDILKVAKKQTETEILQQKAEKAAKNSVNNHQMAAENVSK